MIAVLAGHLQQGRHELLLSEQRTGGHRAHTAGVDGLGHVGSRARQPPSSSVSPETCQGASSSSRSAAAVTSHPQPSCAHAFLFLPQVQSPLAFLVSLQNSAFLELPAEDNGVPAVHLTSLIVNHRQVSGCQLTNGQQKLNKSRAEAHADMLMCILYTGRARRNAPSSWHSST
jgi:hypothetical protein